MIDFSLATLEELCIHFAGNKNNEQDLVLSAEPVPYPEGKVNELLLKYFLGSFSQPEFNAFTFSNGDPQMNPVFNFASEIFDRPESFHFQTVNIAKHLYDVSLHPQIKSGDLFIARISNISLDGESVNAIAIFKSESGASFLKVKHHGKQFDVFSEEGIQVSKPDKGCLIFNIDRDTGYRVCFTDKTNRNIDTRYWTDDFLKVKPRSDEFHQTKDFLTITKEFVTKEIAGNSDITRADQIDLLNRSVEYFKSNDVFEKEHFEQEVFKDPAMIQAFHSFDEVYRESNEVDLPDSFEISAPAVKKQARVFKSVLKLDKNFHIYIHGNRELIERGVDEQGRKYYKIYFNEEN